MVRCLGFYGLCCFGRGDRSEWAECSQEFARNLRGRIILRGEYCYPALLGQGNVISFGEVSDSGSSAGWIGKSFSHGSEEGTRKMNTFSIFFGVLD